MARSLLVASAQEMSDPAFAAVDRYLERLFALRDPVLEATLRATAAAGLPAIQVSAVQGRLLHLLARAIGARRVLEIGTLGGYSTVWLARALAPRGQLVSLEIDPDHARVARRNLRRAGLGRVVEVRVGPALESLARIAEREEGPFDLTFVDADKPSTADYFDWAVRLSRPGGLIVVDNVVRQGRVADARDRDPKVRGMRRCLEAMATDPRVSAVAFQTVGTKGYDGWAVAIVHRPVRPRRRGRSPTASRAG